MSYNSIGNSFYHNNGMEGEDGRVLKTHWMHK